MHSVIYIHLVCAFINRSIVNSSSSVSSSELKSEGCTKDRRSMQEIRRQSKLEPAEGDGLPTYTPAYIRPRPAPETTRVRGSMPVVLQKDGYALMVHEVLWTRPRDLPARQWQYDIFFSRMGPWRDPEIGQEQFTGNVYGRYNGISSLKHPLNITVRAFFDRWVELSCHLVNEFKPQFNVLGLQSCKVADFEMPTVDEDCNGEITLKIEGHLISLDAKSGAAGPMRSATRPCPLKRSREHAPSLSVCVGGLYPSRITSRYGLEILKYYEEMGVSQVYWFVGDEDSFEATRTAVGEMASDDHILSLIPIMMQNISGNDVLQGFNFGRAVGSRSHVKSLHLHLCEYHAKSFDDFLGIHDFDELLVVDRKEMQTFSEAHQSEDSERAPDTLTGALSTVLHAVHLQSDIQDFCNIMLCPRVAYEARTTSSDEASGIRVALYKAFPEEDRGGIYPATPNGHDPEMDFCDHNGKVDRRNIYPKSIRVLRYAMSTTQHTGSCYAHDSNWRGRAAVLSSFSFINVTGLSVQVRRDVGLYLQHFTGMFIKNRDWRREFDVTGPSTYATHVESRTKNRSNSLGHVRDTSVVEFQRRETVGIEARMIELREFLRTVHRRDGHFH